MSFIENAKNSVIVKVIFIGILILILIIPLCSVQSLTEERKSRAIEATNKMISKWGSAQTIYGPILVIPYKKKYRDNKNKLRYTIDKLYVLPENLTVGGDLQAEKRYIGIFSFIMYKSDLNIKGHFGRVNEKIFGLQDSQILWHNAKLIISMNDLRGIGKAVKLKWNKMKTNFIPQTNESIFNTYTIKTHVKLVKNTKNHFSMNLNFQGSEYINFIPIGKETDVKIISKWPHPGFIGNYLPVEREISAKGFKASWQVPYFGRAFPQTFKTVEKARKVSSAMRLSKFGINFYQPVDNYQKTHRAVKYGILFISLTFLTFFLFEILSSLRIHPFQYLLVGSAICLFYLLFLSLSEHINFYFAYILSSLSTIGLISGYSKSVLKASGKVKILTGLLMILYIYLFILLQNEDYSLLIGTFVLFIILALVMYFTRNLDWYGIKLRRAET
jgi:inner membrane protein